jgi:hypothetical protein
MRLAGTLICLARAVAVRLISANSSFKIVPGWIGGRAMMFSSMIVNNFNVARSSFTFCPSKTNPPLLVYANAKLSLPVAAQRFQPIARQCPQILQTCRGFQYLKPFISLFSKGLKFSHAVSASKTLSPLAAVAFDHIPQTTNNTQYVKCILYITHGKTLTLPATAAKTI